MGRFKLDIQVSESTLLETDFQKTWEIKQKTVKQI